MNALRMVGRALTRVEGWLLVLFLSVMVVLAFLQVLLRNLFGTGIAWGDPVIRQMVMWGGFIGAALAAGGDRHISIDAATRYLPERARRGVKTLTNAFATVVCAALARAAWTFVMSEKDSGGILFLGIPAWAAELIIPAGYLMLAVHFLLNSLEASILLFKRQENEVPDA